MIRKLILLIAVATSVMSISAKGVDVDFNTYFTNQTLRIDYQFYGDAKQQGIMLDGLSKTNLWAGRRHNLDKMPLLGNGQLVMKDAATGKVIYQTSFSSLFVEWIATDEAKTTPRSFEHTVLMPMPQKPGEITTTLINASLKTTATYD